MRELGGDRRALPAEAQQVVDDVLEALARAVAHADPVLRRNAAAGEQPVHLRLALGPPLERVGRPRTPPAQPAHQPPLLGGERVRLAAAVEPPHLADRVETDEHLLRRPPTADHVARPPPDHSQRAQQRGQVDHVAHRAEVDDERRAGRAVHGGDSSKSGNPRQRSNRLTTLAYGPLDSHSQAVVKQIRCTTILLCGRGGQLEGRAVHMVRNLVGTPVTGADFFDREPERRRLWDDLHRDHLLLLAPRRVGKSVADVQAPRGGA